MSEGRGAGGGEREGLSRRQVMGAAIAVAGAAACGPARSGPGEAAPSTGSTAPSPGPAALRKLGRTGAEVERVSLGGEGILRTDGREKEATAVVKEALRLGVRYCDTAPAYASSQDYYGMAFREAGPGARDRVFLASKTHARDRDGALALLDESLERLGTDHLDLWQMHDLRSKADLDRIFGKGGAIEAALEARKDGRVRHVGLTGHHDPGVLVEAMRRFDFDVLLVAINPADPARLPFVTTAVAEARSRGMGVVGMKVLGAGLIPRDGTASPEELIHYASSFADTVIIGCSSPAEVRQNIETGRSFASDMPEPERRALEARLGPRAARYASFKAP